MWFTVYSYALTFGGLDCIGAAEGMARSADVISYMRTHARTRGDDHSFSRHCCAPQNVLVFHQD